jgi:aspartate racemase
MGPAATAEFLRLLAVLAPAGRDQDHPKVLVLSDPRIPDRSAAILEGRDDPTPWLREGLLRLADWGADLLAVPCNTAHHFIGALEGKIPVPLVGIVDATLAEARQLAPEGAWLVATSGTRASGVYQEGADGLGYPLRVPDDETQFVIQDAITSVKANRPERARERLRRALRRLWHEEDLHVVAACTEVPLAYAAAGLPPERTVSSLEALALGCLDELYGASWRADAAEAGVPRVRGALVGGGHEHG